MSPLFVLTTAFLSPLTSPSSPLPPRSSFICKSNNSNPMFSSTNTPPHYNSISCESSSMHDEKTSSVTVPLSLVHQFPLSPFRPFLISEPNIQTIVSNFYPFPSVPSLSRFSLRSRDGLTDFYVDFSPAASSPSSTSSSSSCPNPIAVILPGMESNSHAIISRRLINALVAVNFDVYILNYRSCAGDTPPTLRTYHAGFTEDVETLLDHLVVSNKKSDIYICGFSLGANITINYLARTLHPAHTHNVVAAAAVAVPFNPATCVKIIDSGWKGAVYGARLVRDARKKVVDVLSQSSSSSSSSSSSYNEMLKANVDIDIVKRVDRVGKLDDAVIAPVFGFKDRFEYYAHVNAVPLLKHIDVPTLIINAKDDPFYSHATQPETLPNTTTDLGDAPVRMEILEHGGHCAFLDYQTLVEKDTGYFQREISRWFAFVHQRRMEREGEEEEKEKGNDDYSSTNTTTSARTSVDGNL